MACSLSVIVVAATIGGVSCGAWAQFVNIETDRAVEADVSVSITGGDSDGASDVTQSPAAGLFDESATSELDTLGFFVTATTTQTSEVGPERIHGSGLAAFSYDPTPPNGQVLVTAYTEMVVRFDVVEPVRVALDVMIEHDPAPTPATRFLLTHGSETVLYVRSMQAGGDTASAEVDLVPGEYYLQAANQSFTTHISSSVARQEMGSWSFDLRVVVPPPACTGDITGDGATDVFDFAALAGAFGATPGDPDWNAAADLTSDGLVDVFDFAMFAQDFGCAP